MKRSLMFAAAALLAALTLVAAGCGDSDEVPANAVAVVDGTEITRVSLDDLLARAKKSYVAQKRAFPKAGTAEYQSLQTQAVAFLVQQAEYAREAEQMGVDVTGAQITKKINELKKQYFGNDDKKFQKGLAEQGYTEETLRGDIRSQLLTEGIYKEITGDVKVSDADIKAYYENNPDKYKVAESRLVRHILVKTKAEADKLHAELEDGADFAALAKKNSLDPGSKDTGGRLTITRGQTVAPFDKAAFSLKTNALSKPIKTEFGYHLIQALAAIKPGSVTPLTQVKSQIKTQLESEKKNTAVDDWVADVQKEYKDKVSYAAGFEPPDTSTTGAETSSGG
jgi:parvulin-like peptidyl-prolyl isomerase